MNIIPTLWKLIFSSPLFAQNIEVVFILDEHVSPVLYAALADFVSFLL